MFLSVLFIVSIIEKEYCGTNHSRNLLNILIPVIGWFIVFDLNSKNMRKEKRITIKKQAFNEIKPVFTDLKTLIIDLMNFCSNIKGIAENDIQKSAEKNNQYKIKQNKFKKIKTELEKTEKCINNFEKKYSRFLNIWDINKNVFTSISNFDLKGDLWENFSSMPFSKKNELKTIKREIEEIEKNNNIIKYEQYKEIKSNIDKLDKKVNILEELNSFNDKLQNFIFENLFTGNNEK